MLGPQSQQTWNEIQSRNVCVGWKRLSLNEYQQRFMEWHNKLDMFAQFPSDPCFMLNCTTACSASTVIPTEFFSEKAQNRIRDEAPFQLSVHGKSRRKTSLNLACLKGESLLPLTKQLPSSIHGSVMEFRIYTPREEFRSAQMNGKDEPCLVTCGPSFQVRAHVSQRWTRFSSGGNQLDKAEKFMLRNIETAPRLTR